MEAFSLRLGTKQRHLLSTLHFNVILKVLANTIKQEREIKGTQIGKKKIKLSLFTDDMIIYIENLKESIQYLLKLIRNYRMIAGYRLIYRSQLLSCIPTINKWNFAGAFTPYQSFLENG